MTVAERRLTAPSLVAADSRVAANISEWRTRPFGASLTERTPCPGAI
jgi:hypothetical protein